VIAILGPTASGKTDVAEAVRERTGGEIVSADSMQVYQGVPVLTAQPERPTRLMAIWPLAHEASVAEYARLAHAAIDELVQSGRPAIVAGGTGLYVRAALADLALPPAPPSGARARWEALYDERGGESAHALLAERDPAAAATVHPNDRRRVVRALELSEMGASLRPRHNRLWTDETRHPTIVFGLDLSTDALHRRIDARARRMLEAGAADEARRALAGPISSTARHILGLSQLSDLPPEEALSALVGRTRRYAAYQRKWMRRVPGLVSVDADRAADEVADEIVEMAGARERLRRDPAAP
jgi:tRNA dimethylallyltransferase